MAHLPAECGATNRFSRIHFDSKKFLFIMRFAEDVDSLAPFTVICIFIVAPRNSFCCYRKVKSIQSQTDSSIPKQLKCHRISLNFIDAALSQIIYIFDHKVRTESNKLHISMEEPRFDSIYGLGGEWVCYTANCYRFSFLRQPKIFHEFLFIYCIAESDRVRGAPSRHTSRYRK